MNTDRHRLPHDSASGWPAWLVSLSIHSLLIAVAVYWLRPPIVKGAGEPERQAGIVVKRLTAEGPQFADENDGLTDHQSTSKPNNSPVTDSALLDALPSAVDFAEAEAALPVVPGTHSNLPPQSPVGPVDQMTAGAAPTRGLRSNTTVSVFGTSGTGTRFVYVFDRSISMAGAPLRAAKQQLIASLDALDSIHQFQIIFFNHEPQSWDLTGGQNRIAFASEANKGLAESFVRSVSATGGTFRRTALQLALRLRPDVIFFLTDTDDPMSKADLAEAIRRAQRDGIAVNAIEYGIGEQSARDNFLIQLARQTGGEYVYVDTQKLAR